MEHVERLYTIQLYISIMTVFLCCSIRDNANRENLGIVVQYKVKVRLLMGLLSSSDVTLELPFTLTHPKPETPPPSRPVSVNTDAAVDMNLIQLE